MYHIKNEEQAYKIYDNFPALGKRYELNKDPAKMLIILSIKERINGKEIANKYLMDNLDVPGIQENFSSTKEFEKQTVLFCRKSMQKMH